MLIGQNRLYEKKRQRKIVFESKLNVWLENNVVERLKIEKNC